MAYILRIPWQVVKGENKPWRSCQDTPEYSVLRALRQMLPGDTLTFANVTVRRVAVVKSRPRYIVACGDEQITVFDEREAAKLVCEWQEDEGADSKCVLSRTDVRGRR